MSDWLKFLLGVEDKDIPEGAVTAFEFANLPAGSAGLLMLLAALALIAGVFWVYRREGGASPKVKLTLAALRALVLVGGFLLILEPVLAVSQVERVDKGVILLIDDSLSMSTRDRYTDPIARARLEAALQVQPARQKRYELVNAALRESGLVEALARQNDVHVFTFSDGALPLTTQPRLEDGDIATQLPDINPEADENRTRAAKGTDLAGAIRQAIERIGSDRVAAIVLVTDGRSTLGPPPEDVALFLRNKDLVLHTVAVGESAPPRNLRVIDLAGPDRAYRNDPISFDVSVSARGYSGATVEFERRYTDGSAGWARIDGETVVFQVSDQPVSLNFTDRPPRVGTVEYRVSIEQHPDEATHRDNEKTFITRVIDEKAKVLLVSGGPAHEYYAVKNVLLRDTTITLACFLQSADPRFPQDGNEISLDDLPLSEKELFEYGVVILHDPNGDLFPPDWRALLRKFVADHGGGLCFIAGNKHTLRLLRTGKDDDDLSGVLPVVLDLDRADDPIYGRGFGRYYTTPWRMAPEPAAYTHPITRFHSDPRRAKDLVWDRLPPFYWFFPVKKAKPGAVVLARHEDPRESVEPYGRRPILAVHRYGAGNVMFLAGDESHRWRSVAEPVFDRFWVQTVRFLLEGRHAGKRRRFRIYVDREVVDLGDAVQVTAEAFDEHYEPFKTESVHVLLSSSDATEELLELLPVEGADGHYSGSYAPARIGDYALRAGDAMFKDKKGPGPPTASFMVILPDREMGDVRADGALLKDIAARTKGIAVGLDQVHRIGDPKVIPPASEKVVTQGRPVPLWDTWTTIVVILLLLCAEWILRKKFRMV